MPDILNIQLLWAIKKFNEKYSICNLVSFCSIYFNNNIIIENQSWFDWNVSSIWRVENDLRICKISPCLSGSIFSKAVQQEKEGAIFRYRMVGRCGQGSRSYNPIKGGTLIWNISLMYGKDTVSQTLFLGQIWIWYHLRITNCLDCVQKESILCLPLGIKLPSHNHLSNGIGVLY